MNQIKIGGFIAECRKKVNLTQTHLVQKSIEEINSPISLTKYNPSTAVMLIGVWLRIF